MRDIFTVRDEKKRKEIAKCIFLKTLYQCYEKIGKMYMYVVKTNKQTNKNED